jgi:hypothetical protein
VATRGSEVVVMNALKQRELSKRAVWMHLNF